MSEKRKPGTLAQWWAQVSDTLRYWANEFMFMRSFEYVTDATVADVIDSLKQADRENRNVRYNIITHGDKSAEVDIKTDVANWLSSEGMADGTLSARADVFADSETGDTVVRGSVRMEWWVPVLMLMWLLVALQDMLGNGSWDLSIITALIYVAIWLAAFRLRNKLTDDIRAAVRRATPERDTSRLEATDDSSSGSTTTASQDTPRQQTTS